MNRLLVLVVVVLFTLVAACGGAPVLIATEGAYPPFNFINDQGEIDGLERELGDELCKRADLDCEWVVTDWDTMIPDLKAGRFDVILAGMSITDEREKEIDFTDAYYPSVPPLYLARVDSAQDFAHAMVGVSEPTIYSDHFTSIGKAFVGYPTTEDLAEKLLAGEVDAILVDHGYGIPKLAEHDSLVLAGQGPMLDWGLGMGVRKEVSGSDETQDSELKRELNSALTSMKEDGSLSKLIFKWVGKDAVLFE